MDEQLLQRLIEQGITTQEAFDALVERYKAESVTKKDIDNLGEAVVSIMVEIDALKARLDGDA